jgi:hypothetical protein
MIGFDLEKCIEKMVKIEAAVMTLFSLAISARRNWIVGKSLKVHCIGGEVA